MNLTKREILGIVLALIIGLCSFGAWQSFSLVMANFDNSIWWPIIWFSFLATLFFLGAIIWKNFFVRIVGGALVFLPGLFFIRSWEYIVVGILSVGLFFWSSIQIAREGDERTRFHFFRSARAGSFLFIIGLSLLLSSGYYVSLKNASWEELVPRFRIGEEMTRVIFKVAGMVNPSFAKLSEGGLTVDEFLLSLGQSNQDPVSINAQQKNILNSLPQMTELLNEKNSAFLSTLQSQKTAQELFLSGGREQIASIVGRKVSGDEKISDVLSVALQNKLITFLSGEKTTQHITSQAIPFFLSLLLFLTLLSFASVMVALCILVAQLMFFLLLQFRWLTLAKMTVEQEKLVE